MIVKQVTRYNSGYGTMSLYDAYGYQHKTLEAAQCLGNFSTCEIYDSNYYRLYYQAVNMDAFGNITKDQFHKGSLTTVRTYNDQDGIKENTCIDTAGVDDCIGNRQDKIVLGFDKIGNLTSKTSQSGTEAFTYDELNRLKTETRTIGSSSSSLAYTYNANGNLTQKGNTILTYSQQNAGPHAVTNFNGTTLTYDANGNMTTSSSGDFIRDISYSGLSKAYEINNQNNSKSNYFIYDANHNRAVRKDAQNNMRTKTTHYISNVEMIKSASNGNIQSYKRYIGPMVIDMAIGSTPQSQW